MGIFMFFVGVGLLLLTLPIAGTFTNSFNKKRNSIVGIICVLIFLSGVCLCILGINHYCNTPEKYKIINIVCYTSENNDNLYKLELVNSNKKYTMLYLTDEEYELYVQDDTLIMTNAVYNNLKAVGF